MNDFDVADIDSSIPARFDTVIQRLEDGHLAYSGVDGTLTYLELDFRSDRLAVNLLGCIGCGLPGEQVAVGLFLPHDSSSLIGVLGVLKAGHFYVPLDPGLSEAYLRQILADCSPQVLVTSSALLARARQLLASGASTMILCIDSLPSDSHTGLDEVVNSSAGYACIQYTSGTTGQPRGVIRTHRQTLYTAYRSVHDLEVGPGDRVAHLISFAYAFSTGQLFGAILNGASLFARLPGDVTLQLLFSWLRQSEITVLTAPPGLLRGLAEIVDDHSLLPSIRVVATGGESMSRRDVDQLSRLVQPDCLLAFRLSSTEANNYARFMIRAGAAWEGERIPAGYPPDQTEVFIADKAGRPLPRGESGQICVRSRFLSAGYWNLPEETAARFLADPDGGDRRIFLTGDRGMIDSDGLLHHLGRMDFMVKVRGFRVEPESIERALLAHPHLHEGVVIARPSRDGGNQLVAYLVVREQPAPSVTELRDRIARELPSYMIPSRFIFLDGLPRNANHKVDRQALPPPGRARPDLDTPFIAPRSELEQRIAEIWAELLDADEVGVDDSFFELGGDSILAMRMVLQVETNHRLSIPNAFFRRPTISNLISLSAGTAIPFGSSAIATETSAGVTSKESNGAEIPRAGVHFERESRPNSLIGKILLRGPVLRRAAMPYDAGVILQYAMMRLHVLRTRVFARQIALFDECLHDAGLSDPQDEALILNLIANTWTAWRKRVLRNSTTFARTVSVTGDDHIQTSLDRQQGLLVVFAHQQIVTTLVQQHLLHYGIQHAPVLAGQQHPDASSSQKTVHRTLNLRDALTRLRQGGSVLIAGDGRSAGSPLVIPFKGRQLPLPTGFAALAQTSQAAVVTASVYMVGHGQISLEYRPLPTPAATGDTGAMVQAYTDFLNRRWSQLLPAMSWPRLMYLTTLPKTENHV